jgi:arylsulfatase A-like enzyme
MYPTFVELCDLPKTPHKLEGTSIAATLAEPAKVKDREVYLPHVFPESYAIMNREWRYIRYKDGSEELYEVQKDPNEWHNLAGKPKYEEDMKRLAEKAPKTFAQPSPKRKKRNLILDGETFRWKK